MPDRWMRNPDMDAMLRRLVRGKRYLIIWTNDSRRTDRMSVMQFLGHTHVDTGNWTTDWNARPEAGTQNVPAAWILVVEPAADNAKIIIDEKAPVPPTESHCTGDPTDDPDEGWKVYVTPCSNRRPHAPHLVRQGDAQRESQWRVRCPGRETPDLTSGTVSEQWQAQMEDFLHNVRTLSAEAIRVTNVSGWADNERGRGNVRTRVELAKANATAALALALVNSLGDLEPVLSALAQPVRWIEGSRFGEDLER